MPRIYPNRCRAFLEEALKFNTNDCQVWPFYKNKLGYGQIRVIDRIWPVHRLVLKLTDPEFTESLLSLHHCDNPPCFNPRHLYQGVQQDNVNDRERRGRSGKKGRLSPEQVLLIRHRCEDGERFVSVARDFGISPTQAAYIKKRICWPNI